MQLPNEFPIKIGTFRYKQNKPFSEMHLHDTLEIGFCHEGSGVFVISDKVFTFHAKDIVVINSREMHFAQGKKGTKCKWTWIYVDPIKLLTPFFRYSPFFETDRFCGSSFKNILTGANFSNLHALVLQLITESDAALAGHQDAIRGIMLLIMIQLHRLPDSLPLGSPLPSPEPFKRINPALQHIQNYFSGKISVEHLAKICCMGFSNFHRIFRSAMGKSPQQLILEYRIAMCQAELKSTDKSITVISLENGFQTPSCFNRKFKSLMRLSPREWRKQNQ
jgi:AraC-like DNA-binding protein